MDVMNRVRDIRTKPLQAFVEMDEVFWMAGQHRAAEEVPPHDFLIPLAPEQIVEQPAEILPLLGPGDHRRLSSS